MKFPHGRFKTTWALFLLSPLLLCSAQAKASLHPSCSPEMSTWYSTDIVVATEGATIDGNLQVLEVLKGDMKVGAQVSLPELAKFAPERARMVVTWSAEERMKPPTYVTGSRLWLFLIKTPKDPGRWYSTSGADLNTSVVWIEPEKIYSFLQDRNPGPSLLTSLDMSEAQLKAQVSDIVRIQTGIAQAVSLPDLTQRAQALGPLATSPYYPATRLALDELAKCGEAAVPTLRALFSDNTVFTGHYQAADALGKAGGQALGPELTRLLETETRFWKQQGPQLRMGWWNGAGLESEEVEPLRERFSKVSHLLSGLKNTNDAGCTQAVTELRDFWVSLPQLNDPSGLDLVANQCNSLLGTLGTAKANG
ncbi:hypothetical protein IAD21_05714 [Abditibacteriota bacterium]|nr:hypothetical protein IAD21_05714 [Abditibacteriota bacterium]